MLSGRIASDLAIIVVVCVISIFLFPVAQGPYSAIHGPVTALQAVRAAIRVRLSIVAAAFRRAPLLTWFFMFCPGIRLAGSDFDFSVWDECLSILRC